MFYDEATQILASDMQLLEEGRGELLPSGKQSKFDNCAAWARTYLDKAGLIETPSRMFPVWLVKKKIAVHPSRNRIIKRKTRLKHCNSSTIPKKGIQNQAPQRGPKLKLCSKFKRSAVQSPNILAAG